jgi:sec-independent protein translocase protein TatA
MLGEFLTPTHLVFVLVVALLIFGPKRVPEIARGLGKGVREFKGALDGAVEEEANADMKAKSPSGESASLN